MINQILLCCFAVNKINKNSFSANFLAPKSMKLNFKYKKATHITFVRNAAHKMLAKLTPVIQNKCFGE